MRMMLKVSEGKIIASMVGHSVTEYKFSQKNQVKTLATAAYIKSASGERIEMDPQRLYQRLLVTGIGDIPLPDLFQFELGSFPPSLFDNHMRHENWRQSGAHTPSREACPYLLRLGHS